MTDGRVGMACINCHRTYDNDLSWINPAELQAWVQESAQQNRHLVESLVDVSHPRDIDSMRARYEAALSQVEKRAGCLYPSRPDVVPSEGQSRALETLAKVLSMAECMLKGCTERSCLEHQAGHR